MDKESFFCYYYSSRVFLFLCSQIRLQKKDIIVYHAKDNRIEFRGDFQHETIWATQAEIAAAFSVTPQNVTMHIKRIYEDKELLEKATCKESLQVQTFFLD